MGCPHGQTECRDTRFACLEGTAAVFAPMATAPSHGRTGWPLVVLDGALQAAGGPGLQAAGGPGWPLDPWKRPPDISEKKV